MVGDEVLKSRDSHVVIKKGKVILLSLGKLQGNWSWVIGDEVLKSAYSHIIVQKSEIILVNISIQLN